MADLPGFHMHMVDMHSRSLSSSSGGETLDVLVYDFEGTDNALGLFEATRDISCASWLSQVYRFPAKMHLGVIGSDRRLLTRHSTTLAFTVFQLPSTMLNSSSDASPKLNVAPRKGRRSTAPLQIVFIGLSLTEHTDKTFEYFLVVHDGNGVVQSEHNRMSGPFVRPSSHTMVPEDAHHNLDRRP